MSTRWIRWSVIGWLSDAASGGVDGVEREAADTAVVYSTCILNAVKCAYDWCA